MNKKLGLLWKSKALLLALLIILAINISLAQEEPDYSQNWAGGHETEWLENTANWDDPAFLSRAGEFNFFDSPEFLPKAEEFLSSKSSFDPQETKIAQEYVKRIEFIGNDKAVKVGEVFFSAGRENIYQNVDKAEEFFKARWKATYNLEHLGNDFVYNKDDGTLTNEGKIIVLTQYKNKPKVKEIKSTESGFCITTDVQSCFEGKGQGKIDYNAEKEDYTFTDQQGKENQFSRLRDNQGNFLPAGFKAEIAEDGTFKLEGSASGSVFVNNQWVTYTNREGKLVLYSNGNIDSEDTEIKTKTLFVDGAIKKRGNLIEAWDHGYLKDGFGQGKTVVIDLTTAVGVVTQGQTQEEAVKIHLDEMSSQSKFFKEKPKEEQNLEEYRKTAKKLRAAQGDLGQKAEVWIKGKGAEVIVSAKGKVDIGFYDEGRTPLFNKPHFIGENGVSEFDFKGDGKTDCDVRGKAKYSDSQFEKIKTKQDGSSINLKRDYTNDQDIILVDCFSCQKGLTAVMGKRVIIGEETTEPKLFGKVGAGRLDINVVSTAEGLIYQPSRKSIGEIAALQKEGTAAILGRALEMKTFCGEGLECNLQIAKNKEGFISGYTGVVDEKGKEIKSAPLDFSIQSTAGEKVIVTTDKNKKSAEQLLSLLQAKKYNQLAGLKFDKDPELRKFLLEKTQIDINLINNPDYTGAIDKIAEEQQNFLNFKETLLKEYNIQVDSQGNCLSNCQRISEAIAKGERLSYLWTAARITALRAQSHSIEAQKQAGIIGDETSRLLKANTKAVSRLNSIREQIDKIAKRGLKAQEIKYTSYPGNAEALDDYKEASLINGHKRSLRDRITEVEGEIAQLKAQLPKIKKSELAKLPSWFKAKTEERINKIESAITKLEKSKQEKQSYLQTWQSRLNEISQKYIADRPDYAAKLATLGGDTEASRYISSQIVNKYDPDKAKELIAESYLKEGNLRSAALTAKEINPEREVLVQEINQKRFNEFVEQVGKDYAQVSSLARAKGKEMMVAPGFLDWASKDTWFNPFNIFSRLSGNPDYGEILRKLDFKGQETLMGEAKGKGVYLSLLKHYQKEGKNLDESITAIRKLPYEKALELSGLTPRTNYKGEKVTSDFLFAKDSPTLLLLENQALGKEIDEENLAQASLEDAQRDIDFNRGKDSAAEMKLRLIAKRFPNTNAGKQAQGMLNRLGESSFIFSKRFTEKWGDLAIEASTLDMVVPVGAVMDVAGKGVLGISKGITLAADGLKIGSKVKKLAEVVGVGIKSEKALAIADKIKNAAEATARVLTKERYLSSAGKELVSGVEKARAGLKAAEASGEGARIAEAATKLDDTEKALEGWKIAKRTKTGLFRKEIGWTSQSRKANRELEEAVKSYQTMVKEGGDVSSQARAIVEKAKEVQEATLSATIQRKTAEFLGKRSGQVRTAGETVKAADLSKDAAQLEKNFGRLDREGVKINSERGVIKYSMESLPAEKQTALRPLIEENQAIFERNALPEKQIIEGSEKVQVDAAALFDTTASRGEEVISDLRLQKTTGTKTGSISDVVDRAAKEKAMRTKDLQLEPEKIAAEARITKISPDQESLEKLVTQNDLTNLPDQTRFSEDVVQELSDGHEIQIATIDIHKFKDINTEFGHEGGGDIFLQKTGQELEKTLTERGAKVYHKGGKTFKIVCEDCEDDLAKIISEETNKIKEKTLREIVESNPKLKWSKDKFNFYVGVSKKEKLKPGATIAESEGLAVKLNKESLEAGKWGQINICGKEGDCTQIIKQGYVSPELEKAGVLKSPDNIENLIKNEPNEIKNEYSFFGEEIKFRDIDSLLNKRKAALESGDLAALKELDYQLLGSTLKGPEGAYLGNEHFKSFVNYLLENDGKINTRRVFVVGGDELAFTVSREATGKVTVARVDLNFFGKTNLKIGVREADKLKEKALKIMGEVLEDAKNGKIADQDRVIAKTMVSKFNDFVRGENIAVEAEIEGKAVEVRPSMTIGFAESDKRVVALTKSGEKNGASFLSKVADEAQEKQKAEGKIKLLQQPGETKEINPNDFVKLAIPEKEELGLIGKLEKKPTDDLVSEFILNNGKVEADFNYQMIKPRESLEGKIDEALTSTIPR